MIILDTEFNKIREYLGLFSPERGGALFGPIDQPVITYFHFDEYAQTTSVTYVPSLQLIESSKSIEQNMGLQFKGIIHSHPAGFTHPSQGDAISVESLFQVNPHLSKIDLPIVQMCRSVKDESFIYWYKAVKIAHSKNILNGQTIKIYSEEYRVLELEKHAKVLKKILNQNFGYNFNLSTSVQSISINNSNFYGLNLNDSFNINLEIIFLVTIDFPNVSPVVLYQLNNRTLSLDIVWNQFKDSYNPVDCLKNIAKSLDEIWQDENQPL